MSSHPLDVVVLVHDVPAHHLRRGDVGAVVEIEGPDALAVEVLPALRKRVSQVLARATPPGRLGR